MNTKNKNTKEDRQHNQTAIVKVNAGGLHAGDKVEVLRVVDDAHVLVRVHGGRVVMVPRAAVEVLRG